MFSRWRDRFRHAFGFRLAWWYALVFLASSLALILITYMLLAVTLRRHDREFVQSTLIQLAAAYVRGGPEVLRREIQRIQIAGMEGPLFVRTVSRGQDVIFLSMPDGWGYVDAAQLSAPALSGRRTWSTLEARGEERHVLEVLSVRLANGTLFQVGKSTEHREEILRRFRGVLAVAAAAILLIGIAGGSVLTRSALQPLRALADTAGRIMRTGRTTARVPVRSRTDALDELAILVNGMLDRIDAVVAGMRGALDNVGHDLRTPLARLRATAEAALASDDPAVLRRALAECLEETDRVVAMLNTLLDISEAETGTMALHLEPTPLDELVTQTVDLYEDLAEAGGTEIRTNVPVGLVIDVDRSRMRQVLANLVENALKYTPRGGRVEITASTTNGTITIAVTDTGVGIPADELPHVWDRLYRGDKSRSTRGLGLGLSLVKAVVEAHGGAAVIASRPGAGTRVEVQLQRSSAELQTR